MGSLSDDAGTIKILNSDESGVTLELNISDLKTEVQQLDGVRYQAISYQGCGYASEVGNPRVPVSRIFLGAPPQKTCRVQVLDAVSNMRTGYRLPPVPRQIVQTKKDIQTITGKYDENGSAYHSSANTLYPRQLVEVIYDGYIRDQRVITVELRPVQYNPKRRMLKVHSRLVVKVTFDAPSAAPNLSSVSGFSAKKRRVDSSESKVFEDFYRKKLVNYDNAKYWRKMRPPRPSVSAAPSKQMKPLYKIFVEKTGVYRITYDDLNEARGQEGKGAKKTLSLIDPRNLSLRLRGKEIPIYVHGEADGKFDKFDYIEFLGLKTDSIYTRWNVYWLTLSDSPRKRVAELNGAPGDPTGVLVSTFKSKIHFEEDRFYQVLQHVSPEDVSPGDPHAWYQARDHWFWTGIKNSSDKNEVELKFRLYDVAPTLDRPKIELLLTGGAPTQHEILTSINGIKIANAKWDMQDEMRITKYLRSQDELVDAKNGYNVIRCAKVDTTTEENALSYPYHIYIDSFDVEYVRLLLAVNDYLFFKSPESRESYEVRKHRKLEYKVSGFLYPNVELFETNGSVLLAKIKNPSVRRVILTREERKRLRVILQDKFKAEHPTHSFAEEEEQIAAPRQAQDRPAFDDVTINVPTVGYNVTFQYPDTHDAQFIAVSQGGLLKPARLVKVRETGSVLGRSEGTNLKETSNGADYIIITHPIFMESAQRLGDWRRTSKGGNYRVKVVDVTDVYDEFNYGMVSPQAIKDFLKYAYFNWQQPAVSYVVLFGDGTFDFKGIDKKTYPEPPELSGYIPPHYVWTTYGDTSTDHWYATVSGIDVLPDFFIGRLTVETQEEAAAVVDKILKYEGNRPNGLWRRRIISIADDDTTNSGDFIFKKSLSEISQNHTLLGFETTKIFLEDIMEQVNANPAKYGNMLPGQVARKIITEELSKGAVMAQYAGHGGRVVWAHEIIFDNYAVQRLRETDKLPFLLVLSCYNGYFDKPGTPSMAEALLRLPNSGIIGMLSATRLTYGSGNDALNKIIFDDIFKRNMRGLGEIAFNSKLELLITDGYGQFEVMQQYTLFGDPATKIAMAEYEITPEIQTPTVKAGGTLRLATGKIFRSTYDEKLGRKRYVPISDFSGKLKVTARMARGQEGKRTMGEEMLEISVEKDVSFGEYPEVELRIPMNAKSGKGVVEYYAENETEIAVGGTVFSVEIPKIVDIIEEVVGEPPNFRIAAKVADELEDAGIKEVALQWRNPVDGEWREEKMKADKKRGAGWYTTGKLSPSGRSPSAAANPSSYDGGGISYQIIVVDVENNRVESEQRQFSPLVIPNLKVVYTQKNEPLIYYTADAQSHPEHRDESGGTIKVEIENTGDVDIKEDVEVYLYDGNPDQNEDNIVDEEAKLLGRATVTPDKWVKRNLSDFRLPTSDFRLPRAFKLAPLNINRIAVAELKYTLPIGRHAIFAWIDPEFNQKNQKRTGKIKEQRETDNKASQVIKVNEYFILPEGVPVSARSLDDVMQLTILPKSIEEVAVLKVSAFKKKSVPQAMNQPKTTAVTLPAERSEIPPAPFNEGGEISSIEEGKTAAAYQAMLSTDQKELFVPATVELKFDIDALREKIKGEIGLGDIPSDSLDEAQKASLEQAIEEESKNQFAIYLFEEASQKWVRLESKTVVNPKGEISRQAHPANIRTKNAGTGTISDVKVDNEKTPQGVWALMFISDSRYHLFFGELSSKLQEIMHNVDIFQLEPFQEEEKGISITVTRGDKLFEFGDVLRFETTASTSQEEQWVTVSYSKDANDGDGVIEYLTADENTPVDKWVIFFLDSTHFRLYGKRAGLVEQNGEPLMGAVGEEFFDPNSFLRFKIIAGETPFSHGDRFVFETREVGKILAKTQHLGIFSIMRGADYIPPDIQFGIGHQNFADGDPVSSNPQISALIADDNGVDLFVRKPELSISYNDGDFRHVLETEYLLSLQPGSNQAVLNYSPTLQEGKYELQLLAYDTDGNMSKESTTFYVRKTLQLLNVMNYPNPFPILPREGTDITFEITSEVDEVEVKIYTIAGRLIRVLYPEEHIGFIMAYWDGRDEYGDEVANGVYYGKVTVKREGQKDLTEIVKMMKLR